MRPGEAARRRRCAVAALALALASCGYRPLTAQLPGDPRSVQVVIPHPGRTGEPELPGMIVRELVYQLAASGLRASSAAGAAAALRIKLVSLNATDAVLDPSGSALAARGLTLSLELWLVDRAGRTLWRSGLLQVHERWPHAINDAASTEASRRLALRQLAAHAAAEAALLLTAGL